MRTVNGTPPDDPQMQGIKKTPSEDLAAVLDLLDEADKYGPVFGPHIRSHLTQTRQRIETVLTARNEPAAITAG